MFARPLLLAALGSLVLALRSEAILVMEESFVYTAGEEINGKTGGSAPGGFTAGWVSGDANAADRDVISNGGLSYQDLVVSGNALSLQVSPGSTALVSLDDRNLNNRTRTSLGGVGVSLWVGFLVRQDVQTNTVTDYFSISVLPTGGNPQVDIGTRSDSAAFGLWAGNPAQISNSAVNVAVNTTYFLVAKFTLLGTNLDTVDLFINPTPGSTEPAIGSRAANLVNINFPGLDRFTVGADHFDDAFGNEARWTVDEIRMGTSYADVAMPEPGALALVFAGGAAVAMRRFRRRG